MSEDTSVVDTIMSEYIVAEEEKEALKELVLGFDLPEGYKVDQSLIDYRVAQLDEMCSKYLDAIMHSEAFQDLEATWRGLERVVDNTSFEEEPVVLELLNTSKEALRTDFANKDHKNESALWQRVYFGAYDLANGHPYTFMMGDFEFTHQYKDVTLLEDMAILSEMCQLPFLSNASPELFKHDSFQDLANDRYIETVIKESPEHVKWNEFRHDDRSKYVGLALPRVLGRAPYNMETSDIKSFDYNEALVEGDQDNSLWVGAAWSLVSNMIRSYENHGWPVKIVGVDSGGRVDSLPSATYEDHGKLKQKTPFDAILGLEKDQELTDMGFMPITYYDRTNYGTFHEAASTRIVEKIKNDPQATQTNKVAAGLQYTMLVCRIGHYLKQRHLRFVGRNATKSDLEKDLKSWLDQYVADMPNPQESVVAERPLRSYMLSVEDSEDIPGFFEVNLELRPHVAVIGADVRLKLVAFHEQEEK